MDKASYCKPGVSNVPRRLCRLIAGTALVGKWNMVPLSVTSYINTVDAADIKSKLGDFGSLLSNGRRTPRSVCHDHLREELGVLLAFPNEEDNKICQWMNDYQEALDSFHNSPAEEFAKDATPASEYESQYDRDLRDLNDEFLNHVLLKQTSLVY